MYGQNPSPVGPAQQHDHIAAEGPVNQKNKKIENVFSRCLEQIGGKRTDIRFFLRKPLQVITILGSIATYITYSLLTN